MTKKSFFIMLFIGFFILSGCSQGKTNETRNTGDGILYYTCGMHPSVKVSVEEYNKGKKSCPICNMYLTPVHKEEQKEPLSSGFEPLGEYYGCGMEGTEHVFLIKDAGGMTTCPMCGMALKRLSREEAEGLKGVVSKVKIKGKEAQLAGVKTEPLKKIHLYKEIRTVGKVAYDPELVIAQEEFISALKTFDRVQEGNIGEIKERALNLIESSRRRLKLLGLSDEQIKELEEKRKVETSLILPEEVMWIYGDVYEYEMGWVKPGEKIKVLTSSFPGEEFRGIIASVNPVLDPKTRSVRFRTSVENPDLKLKPEMYVDIIIMSMYTGEDGEHMVLAIPKDAVLDTGMRKIVWIDSGTGEYEGRIVEVGPEAIGEVSGEKIKFYPVLKGLSEGEKVVVKANFLIDSQSQISGVAASAYGGAVGAEDKKAPLVHQH